MPKPSRAEEVLAAVAARYPAGSTVTQSAIAEACGADEGLRRSLPADSEPEPGLEFQPGLSMRLSVSPMKV